jgi:hypothetical protein
MSRPPRSRRAETPGTENVHRARGMQDAISGSGAPRPVFYLSWRNLGHAAQGTRSVAKVAGESVGGPRAQEVPGGREPLVREEREGEPRVRSLEGHGRRWLTLGEGTLQVDPKNFESTPNTQDP